MRIHRAGESATREASGESFTGRVWQDPVVTADAPARLRALRVSFAPGARTHWHTHPLGQTLYVVSGIGRVQEQGKPVMLIQPGDTVWIAPGEKHWHGASPDHFMVHLAMQEHLDGAHVQWMEPVSDEEYHREPGS